MNTIIVSELTPIVRKILRSPELHLTPELSPADIPQWDSVSNIMLIDAVERHFGLNVELKEMLKTKNVEDLVNLIEQKVKTVEK